MSNRSRGAPTIVGLELTITRLEGKWKTSQNRPPHDRAQVIRELIEQGGESSVAMAKLMEKQAKDFS